MPRPIHSAVSSLEILEARIAPAAITTFTEADGDIVKISTSKGTKTQLDDAIHGAGGKLQLIDFSNNAVFAGTTISVAVSTLGATGNGIADVGYINATGISLGAVLVKGDLGKIIAGASITKTGVASLTVNSLGSRGIDNGAPDLVSTITGNLGPLKVFTHIEEAALTVNGKLASATVGGHLVGGSVFGSGSITVTGASGPIKIGGDLEGGSGINSGSLILSTTAKNGAITINGDINGGGATLSGAVRGGSITKLFVGGNLYGGSVATAGSISANSFTSIAVSGDVYGGTAEGTGLILVGGSGTSITVGGSLFGGSGVGSAVIGQTGLGVIGSITVKGSLVAGSSMDTGEIGVNTVGSIFVGGSLNGGGAAAVDGGTIQAGNVKSITVAGSLNGNAGPGGGSILFLTAGAVKVGGNITGQLSALSGAIKSLSVGSLEVGGSLFQSSILIGGMKTPDNALVAKTVHIGGTVSSSYLAFGSFERANVNVGTVQIDGSWNQSDLVVGAINIPGGAGINNANFGDTNDALAVEGNGVGGTPTIASITIEGAINGTPGGTDHYGFVAGKIGAFRAGAAKVRLKTNEGNDQIDLASTLDVTIHEIGTAKAGTAPAAPVLSNAGIFDTFTDTDGDTVRITSSKGTKLELHNAVTLTPGGQLQKLDLSATKSGQHFNGANITISVVALGAQGNGVVDVGEIDATGIALGAVTVKGDLGRITAGTLATKPAIGSLTLDSLGLRLTSTGAPDLHSAITGNLGPVKILGDVQHAFLDVAGTLGATTIGGNLIGGTADFEGYIKAAGNAGAVKIGGAIYGGSANFSGALSLASTATGKVTSIFVGGDLAGSDGASSGSIFAGATGAVSIGGNLGAGTQALAGVVNLNSAKSFSLGGDLSGGSTAQTGFVQLTNKSGSVAIGGNLRGTSADSGKLTALAPITTFAIQGTIRNGSVSGAGTISLTDATSIFVGGTVYGNGAATGAVTVGGITAGKVGTITINGSLVGGGGGTSGTLSLTSATTVKILGDIGSLATLTAGNIHATQSIGTLDVSGKVQGARILIGSATSKAGSMVATKVHVGGNVSNTNFYFGSLERADVKVGTATFDGDWFQSNLVVGTTNLGTDDIAGGDADNVNFGDGHDHRAATGNTGVPSSIASIIVEGRILGTGTAGDHFGFVANKITAFRAGAITLPLHATGVADTVTLGANSDVSVTEAVL